MYYIIQENTFREEHYDNLKKSLNRLNLNYTTVRVYPYVDKIVDIDKIPKEFDVVEDLEDYTPLTKNVFVFGSVKLARIASENNWYIGSLLNGNHDYEVYSKYYKENLLNYDSKIYSLSEKIKWKKDEVKFIRPTLDSKSFTGAVFSESQFNLMINRYLHNYKSSTFNENTKIQVSTPKKIYKEIRFWVVGGKVITGSQYQLGGRYTLDDVIDDDAFIYAQKMVDLFQLAEAFVIDICLTDSGWKIVECGCINAAGFYKSNLQKVLVTT